MFKAVSSKTISQLVLAATLSSLLAACAPAVVGGAAAGGAVAVDRRTAGIFLEDQNIELKAERQMRTNLGEDAHINITSYNRNVLLTGEAPTAEAKVEAENLTKEIPNVRNITNEITVGLKSSISSRANDAYITSKVKANFLAEKNFNPNNVKVVTENGAAYLMGIVSQQEGALATEIARTTKGVQKVVKVFEYTN